MLTSSFDFASYFHKNNNITINFKVNLTLIIQLDDTPITPGMKISCWINFSCSSNEN
jgi:hypothetical protein